MTFHKDDQTAHRLPMTDEEQILMCVEAGKVLLNFYATDSNIARAASDIACVKKISIDTSVQFADILRSWVVRCRNV